MTLQTSKARFHQIAFIGLGLIGGSLAKLIRHQLSESVIWALDQPEVTTAALNDGLLNDALQNIEDARLLEADLIIVATHLSQSRQILETLAERSKAMATPLAIMDIGSTKQSVCQWVETLSGNFVFIGGHPLAGREVSGYANSLPTLFSGKRFLLTPCQKTPPDFQAEIEAWLTQLGTIPVAITAEEHDRLMSVVSHFPQFYAIALANLLAENQPETLLHFLGGGIDDQMRLMASPYVMWKDVFHENKANMNAVLTQFIGILQAMQADLNADDLSPWFEHSQDIHQRYKQLKLQLMAAAPAVRSV